MDETNQQATAAKSDVYHREFDVDHNGNGPRLPAIPTNCPIAASNDRGFFGSDDDDRLHRIMPGVTNLPCPLFINERHLPRSLLSILLEKKENEKQKEQKKMAEIELQQPDRGEKNDAAPQSIFAKAQRPINLEVHERPTLGPCQFYSCS
ncbi:hypothetical protein GW17_00003922 [Ensete ventricosum]|nr:hypothetical protein GW17_00003922 [Ensete ventricosum]